MRILILSQYYKPEPILKPSELAVALQAAGDEVSVITGLPNYPKGKLHPGYGLRLLYKERIDGVEIVRTFEYPYHGRGSVGRIINYLSFMFSAPFALLLAPRFDVMYVWHPPLTVGISAWIIAAIRRVPFVYDVQDIWPEAAVLAGILKPGLMVKILSRIEQFVYCRAKHVIVVTEGAKQNLINKGVPKSKVSVLPHWFRPDLFMSVSPDRRRRCREKHGWSQKFVLLFAGNMGLVQGLDTILESAKLLEADTALQIVFVGDGADKTRLQEVAVLLGLKNVCFIDRQELAVMPQFMAAADAYLVHLKWSELSDYVIPTKTLAYLASGRPILMAMSGAAADLIRESNSGVVVSPENPHAVAAGVRQLMALSDEDRAKMGNNGRKYLQANLSESVILPKYRELLHSVARDMK